MNSLLNFLSFSLLSHRDLGIKARAGHIKHLSLTMAFTFVFVCLVFTVLTIVKTLLLAVRSAVYWPPPRCGQPFPFELAFISPQDFRCACEMSQSGDTQDPSAPSPGALPSLNIRVRAEDVREAVVQGGTGGESSHRPLVRHRAVYETEQSVWFGNLFLVISAS